MGRMFLVDLAGSERLKKSKSVGLRAQEAKAINRSLHMLGMCVNARSDPAAQHVPFRDSKLTRLLQESLGGNAKTSMIIAVSDVKQHADETFQSCLFGSRAILVRTQPTINEFLDLSALNEEIAAQLRVRPDCDCMLLARDMCVNAPIAEHSAAFWCARGGSKLRVLFRRSGAAMGVADRGRGCRR